MKNNFISGSFRILQFAIFLGLIILPASAADSVVFFPSAAEVSTHTGESISFSTSSVNSSDVTWLLDGVMVQKDLSCTSSVYLVSKNEAEAYNLTVIVDDGTNVLTNEWFLEVIPDFDVTFSPDSEFITSRLDREPEFSVNVSEGSDILWYLDDELINTYANENDSSYIPSVSETENYSIKVHISNDNGSVWNQWYWTATATPSQIISGSSSGGTSSGSVFSAEDYSNVKAKYVSMQVVNKGAVTKFSFPDEKNPFDYLEFKSTVNSGYVKTTLEVLNNRSSSVSKNPDNAVYCYSNIILSNTVLESKMDDTRIIFHVDKGWIDENRIDVDSIRLNLYSNSDWKSFPVKVVNENDGNVSFVSTTSGFGNFAITGKANETLEDDIVVVDMGGSTMSDPSGRKSDDSGNRNNSNSENEDVLGSVLRSMKELFIKRNPVNN
ncbi:PGF-pre-PGF domain-containing protein [Methanolobus mangrovi]|uniref:PGF-pre-PGF domain-containing protein n=1 Tax=Methanolobus mangrovi TaxID=3072977 RepID=A0AA51YJD2_9EURY|nr:PGF-pre-PGF domain-containing protein [Methanolobus mangrovi]WMW22473.1 PGF-pre-PGF domain-containing protein [Methanolobus mangrovi]